MCDLRGINTESGVVARDDRKAVAISNYNWWWGNIMWAGNLSNFSQPCPEWLKWKITVKDIADWHMRRDQTEATRPSVTNRCLGLHASGFRRWFHSYSQQPLTTIRNQFGNTFFLWDQLLPDGCRMWVGPYCLSQWKQISFVDLLNGVHRVGPEGNLGCGSNESFVSSSPLQNTGARECEQSNQATVSPTNSLTH